MVKDFIKKYWRELMIAILLIFLYAIVDTGLNTIKDLKEEKFALLHSKDSSFTIAKQYIGKNGELVSQVQTHELTIKELKETGDELGFSNKELKKQVGSLNNLVGYWKGQAGFSGRDTVRTRDTVFVDNGKKESGKLFNWSNKYLSIDGGYYPYDSSVVLDYKYDIGGFELTAYRKKQGNLFNFKPSQLVADIRFGDQNMKVGSFQGMVVKEEPKKWYQTKGFWIGIGFIGGVFIAK